MENSYLYKKFKKSIDDFGMINSNDNIVIGLSGGADSYALFQLLVKYIEVNNIKANICAVHINHNARDDSHIDEENCRMLSKRHNVRFLSKHINLSEYAKENGMSKEEAGRYFRYKVFNSVFTNGKIFVGHNKDDNVETVLLNLIRGTGMNGLTGILPVSNNIYRPLLECSKEEIYKFCKEFSLNYRDDYTNFTNDFNRNKIRNEVLPIFNEINSNALNNIDNLTRTIRCDNDYIQKEVIKAKQEVYDKDKIIVSKFVTYDEAIQKRLVFELFDNKLNITKRNIKQVLDLAKKNDGKKTINLPNGYIVCKEYDYIYIDKLKKQNDNDFNQEIKNVKLNELINTKYNEIYLLLTECDKNSNDDEVVQRYVNFEFSIVKTYRLLYNILDSNIFLRTRKVGDKIYLKGLTGHKKLKNYFIDRKIPISVRNEVPLLAFSNEEVLLICDDKFVCNNNYISNEDRNISLFIIKEKLWKK